MSYTVPFTVNCACKFSAVKINNIKVRSRRKNFKLFNKVILGNKNNTNAVVDLFNVDFASIVQLQKESSLLRADEFFLQEIRANHLPLLRN